MGEVSATERTRVPFVLGRLTPATAEIVLVDGPGRRAAAGPWRLSGLVRPARSVRFADA